MQMHWIHFSNVQNKSTLPNPRFQVKSPHKLSIMKCLMEKALSYCMYNFKSIVNYQHTWNWLNNFGILGSILQDLLYLTFSFRQIFHKFPSRPSSFPVCSKIKLPNFYLLVHLNGNANVFFCGIAKVGQGICKKALLGCPDTHTENHLQSVFAPFLRPIMFALGSAIGNPEYFRSSIITDNLFSKDAKPLNPLPGKSL